MQNFQLNCDLGEGGSLDYLLMPYLDACSIACGGHYGDENTMTKTVESAMKHQVSIGAHPSFPDRENFGRQKMTIPDDQLKLSLFEQVSKLNSICQSKGQSLSHIKTHGALYNLAATDIHSSELILEALESFKKIPFLAPVNSVFHRVAIKNGFTVKLEAFADRRYNSDLTLVNRTRNDAVIESAQDSLDQVISIAEKNVVTCIDGTVQPLRADTFCIHGDNPSALDILKMLKSHQHDK